MTAQIGVDLGGTFTDVVSIDEGSGEVRIAKVPTVPAAPASGFVAGVDAIGVDLAGAGVLVHGTTLATNAVLERTGVVTGLITTRGFRDVLAMGRRRRPSLWGLRGTWAPLVPRRLSREVDERRDASGAVLVPLAEDQVLAAARELRDAGCAAIVVSFLHAYVDDEHERRAAELVRSVMPGAHVVTGAAVLPQAREFDRTATAAVAGYVGPLVGDYIADLRQRLGQRGMAGDFLLMQGNGGVVPASEAMSTVVTTVLSGPAAGVVAAAEIARQDGFDHAIAADMGGTSLDVALVDGGEPSLTTGFEVDFNVPLRVPLVDIRTIGAGGGSIARVDGRGVIRVGPESAGADPGPVCYGRGGTQVTVTDANDLLGRIVAARLPSIPGGVPAGELAARFAEQVGAPLGLGAHQAAQAVIDVANASMAGAMRRVAIEKGQDPRDLAVVVYGGAGPLHGVELARLLGARTVVVPYYPGLTCALGCLLSDIRREVVLNVNRPLHGIGAGELRDMVLRQERAALALVPARSLPVTSVSAVHVLDVRYAGQSHVFRLRVHPDELDGVKEQFDKAYTSRYGVDLSDRPAVVVSLWTAAVGHRPRPALGAFVRPGGVRGSLADARKEERDVWLQGTPVRCPVYERHAIPVGSRLRGPAVLDQLDSTVLLPGGSEAEVTVTGSLVVSVDVP